MYMGRKIAQVRIGTIPPETKPEWVVNVQMEYEIICTNKTVVNWWGFSLEVLLSITEETSGNCHKL